MIGFESLFVQYSILSRRLSGQPDSMRMSKETGVTREHTCTVESPVHIAYTYIYGGNAVILHKTIENPT